MKLTIMTGILSLLLSIFTSDMARASESIIKYNAKLTRTDVLGKTKSMASVRVFFDYEEMKDPTESYCIMQIGRYDVLSALTEPEEKGCFKVPSNVSADTIIISDDSLKEIAARSLAFSIFTSESTFDNLYDVLNETHFNKITRDANPLETLVKKYFNKISSSMTGGSHTISLTNTTVFEISNGQDKIRIMLSPEKVVETR